MTIEKSSTRQRNKEYYISLVILFIIQILTLMPLHLCILLDIRNCLTIYLNTFDIDFIIQILMLLHPCILLDIRNYCNHILLFVILLILNIEKSSTRERNKKYYNSLIILFIIQILMLMHLCFLFDIRNFGYLTLLFVILLILTIEKNSTRQRNKKYYISWLIYLLFK